MIRFMCCSLGITLAIVLSGLAHAQPKKVSDEQMKRWVETVSKLEPDEQEKAFLAKMGELNPMLDTASIKIVRDKDEAVRELLIPATYAVDIRAVALYRDLEMLQANGSPSHISKVSDVSCLRGLTKLKVLSLGHTSVADLSSLADLPVEKLYLPSTPVKDIRALKKLPLTHVELPAGVVPAQLTVLTDKEIRSFITHGTGPENAKQVKAIFGKSKLETYRVGKSTLESLEPLGEMPLTTLGLGESPRLKSLAPLKGCESLRNFSITKAPIADLTPFAGKLLERLELPYCPGVRDLTPVKEMPNLFLLSLYGSGVNDLTPVSDLKKLESLWINETRIKSLKPIVDMPKVKSLDLRKTVVQDRDYTPITKLPALTQLWVDETPATVPLLKKLPPGMEIINGKNVAKPK